MKGYVRSVVWAAAAALVLAVPVASAQRDGWRPGDGWDRDIEFRCESENFRYHLCQVDTGRGGRVELVDQVSGTDCIEGRTWGSNRAGVWVDKGCAGVFRVERRWNDDDGRRGDRDGRRGDGDWRPGAGFEQQISVRCASRNFAYSLCQVDTGRGSDVRLARQISGTACVEGRTWGWNRAGIWVDGGCEGVFMVERRWR